MKIKSPPSFLDGCHLDSHGFDSEIAHTPYWQGGDLSVQEDINAPTSEFNDFFGPVDV